MAKLQIKPEAPVASWISLLSTQIRLASHSCAVIVHDCTWPRVSVPLLRSSQTWRPNGVTFLERPKSLSQLKRDPGTTGFVDPEPPKRIPFFAVGYKGWERADTVKNKLCDAERAGSPIDGIAVIQSEIYCGLAPDYDEHSAEGSSSVFGLLLSIEQLTSSMVSSKPEYLEYGEQKRKS